MTTGLRSKGSVMVVDDEETFCGVIVAILQEKGYLPYKANNAAEARLVLESSIPDVILMDMMMPGVDGLTLIRQLKSDPALLRTWFVVVSAKVMKADRRAAWAAGADGFLAKPFTMDELLNLLDQILSPPPDALPA